MTKYLTTKYQMKTKIYYKRLKFRSKKYNEKTPYFFDNYTILNNKIHRKISRGDRIEFIRISWKNSHT